MTKLFKLFAVFAFLLFTACSTATIYTKPEFSNVTNTHKTIAILPFTVNIDSKHQSKEFTLEVAKKSERDEAYMFQQQIYSQFLKRQAQGKYTVEFQDADQTNAVLAQYGITYENISSCTKSDIAHKLGVDAVISGTIRRSKPMSSGGAIALGVLFGSWGSTNRVDITINLHNGSNNDLLWKYDHQASGTIGSSPEELAKSLMNSISKQFPYKKEK